MTMNSRASNTTSTTTDALNRMHNDPLNLSEYTARSPRFESLLQQSPSPSSNNMPQSPGTILAAFSDFPISFPSNTRAYSTGFPSSFDRTQLKQPTSTFTQSSVPPIPALDNFGANGARSRLSVSSATDSVDQRLQSGEDGFGTNATPASAGGYGIATSTDGFGDDNPLKPSSDNGDRENAKSKGQKEDKNDIPPWSEMKTKAGKERKRLPLACIACRRKKIRCSGEKPACKHCLRSRIPCVYKVTTRKAAPRTDYMAMLDKRLKRMEDRVIKLIPKDTQAVVASIPRAVVKPALPTPPAKAATGKKRPAEEAFGQKEPDLNEWAKNRQTNQSADPTTMAKGPEAEDSKLLTEGAEALPSGEIQHHLAEVYFEYVYGQSYPLLHKPSFMRKLAAGTVPPVLLLAVCAISARFSTHPQIRTEPAFLRGEQWASVAREIALKRYDTPNITILIVYILLGLHEFGTCQGGRSWMFGGMAQRMAFALQLHRDLDHDLLSKQKKENPILTPTDREIRRRTMWSCFLMDRFNSSGTDRPMSMREEFINVPLPIKESCFQMEVSGPTDTISGNTLYPAEAGSGQLINAKENMGTAAYLIRLVAIWGRIVRYWNLGGRDQEKYPMWSTQSEFHNLKESLRSFHANLPESLRYNGENLQTHSSEKTANQFLFMHIVYHQLLLFMHRFALPFSGYGRPSREMPQQFHTEAARTALEAANQVSTLIKEAMEHSVTAPFAGYCAFYASTVHIHGIFSKNPKLEATAKQNLAYNVKYLSKMKKYWGMFHFVAENLKDLYRQHADAALRGPGASATGKGSHIFQYGDWFDRYPHGVSHTDFEEAAENKKAEPGTDAVLGQKSDLQSVEDFFATLSPPSENRKKARTRKATTQQHNQTGEARKSIQQGQNTNGAVDTAAFGTIDPTAFHTPIVSGDGLGSFDPINPFVDHSHPLLFQPGMLSQLDRHMVLSSYAGMDPGSAASISNTMNHTTSTADGPEHATTSSSINVNGASATTNTSTGNLNDLWNLDLASLPPTAFSGYTDPSTHWFMPFNLDPPSDVHDDGLGLGASLPYGLGLDSFGHDGLTAGLDLGGGDGTTGGTGS
jgi:Fungal specific transcription factor domain/Fungal Zn(2)-Cys(6) binuclear cluster domain